MKNLREIMQVSLPVAEAADLATRAAAANVGIKEYLGYLVLSGAYGLLHPEVRDFLTRAKAGVYGPKTVEPAPVAGEPEPDKY
jgi:hypothetical protein